VLIFGDVIDEGLSASLYDPTSGTFSSAPGSTATRSHPTVTALVDGLVLFVGGNDGSTTLALAELYRP